MSRNTVKTYLIMIIAICFTSAAVPLHAKTYTVGIVEWEPWATAYVAAEKGFWKLEGIDVAVKQFDDYMGGSIKAFKFGKIDFGIMMLGNAVDLIRKAPRYTIIYEHDWSHGGDLFILSGKLDSIEELKGKRIGTYSTAAPIGFFLDKVLQNAHLKIKDVELIEVSDTSKLNKSFRNGVVSAIVSYDPEASKVVDDGAGKLVSTSADFPGVIPEGIVVQNRILRDNPGDVQKFLRGWLRAVKWQSDPANREEYFAILKRTMFNGSSYSVPDFKKFSAGAKIHGTLKEITKMNEREIQVFIKELLTYLKQNGNGVKSFDPHYYISTDLAVKEAKKIF